MKIYPNLASTKMQQLISLLSDLEHTDRQRMSSDGQEALDNIFELLGIFNLGISISIKSSIFLV